MANEEQPEWIFPRTFERFEEEGAEDLNALYNNVVHLLRDYQIRAHTAENQAETLTSNLTNAEATITRLRQHRDNLQHQLSEATGAPPRPPPPPPPADENPPPRGARSERIPDPPMFDGTRTALPRFTLKLKAKLRTNADRFLSERAMVDYAISRLEGKALDIIMSHSDEATEDLTITTMAKLFTTLKEAFGDPDPINTARRELQALRQGKGDFASYYSEFTRIVSKLGYNEAAKRSTLELGMSEGLKDSMVTVFVEDKTYPQYVALLQKLDNNQRARKEDKAGIKMGSFTSPPTPSYSAGHPSFSPGGLAPMDLSALRNLGTPSPPQEQRYVQINGRRKLAPAEKQWRMDNGRCAFCAEAGHTFQQCPPGTQRGGRSFPLRVAEVATTPNNQGAPPPIPARPAAIFEPALN